MKILTNARFAKVAGIAQTLSSFIKFVDQTKNNRTKIVGVDLSWKGAAPIRLKEGSFSLIAENLPSPDIIEAIKSSNGIANLQERYAQTIAAYRKAIIDENPDVILINGTYFMPWCLLLASQGLNIPTILHYHGSISKETEHWREEPHRNLFLDMERQFDQKNLFYIFPSILTQQLVEKEIFLHPIEKYSVLPNPIPLQFFEGKPRGKRKRIGVVGRWTRIKNPNFTKRLARYNAKHGSEFTLDIVSDVVKNSRPHKDLAGLVTFTKPMSNIALSKFYASMGVVISPSYFETYGNVAKEALASGVPALVSSQMGVAETFRELGLSDWITDFRSVRDVYTKIREVSGQAVPAAVRLELQEKHSPAYLHGKMLNIINSI